MTKAARKLFDEALGLESDDRAELACLLLDSLDGESDEGVEVAWSAEVARRLAELESGAVKSIPWDLVRAEALAKIHGARNR